MRNKRSEAENTNIDRLVSTEKVDAILAGAMGEFLAHGYAATTMDKVTAAAGVSKTTVYSYFQDKEGLFTALIERLAQKNYREAFSSLDAQFLQEEPHKFLRRIGINIVEQINHQQELLSLVRLIIGESGRFPLLAQAFVRNVDKPALELLSQYFAAHPELQLPDSEVAARIFLGTLIHFTILQEMLHCRDILPMERDRLIDNLIHLMTINHSPKSVATDQYSGTRQKSPRRKRSSSGKFKTDYGSELKHLRSIRLTDTAWEKLAALADENNLTRSEMIEIFARTSSSGKQD
ncbi:TetR/AcrR family transcriptional regulator [Nostocaceae cyanobacterium CENA357]|uniref:TetR/AcrR family transcriptional regulator n=1 Tax=Atlanticothrix silvestris CENA357 TaxID=1725252 RepID=A0A8J7H9U7_9CYAN|nr:TetR/AcrR family transcriptional regulator [Atlanticothrix silvestris]MBH8552029.1 TetR/AcrR family transcriptional regulator [Atlanticothrix silvestris CENA357]